jgi:hypothetical protein
MTDLKPMVDRLWPRGKWITDEWSLFSRKVGAFNLDQEQIRAVLEEERANSDYSTPNMKSILNRMRAAQTPQSGPTPPWVESWKTPPAHDRAGPEWYRAMAVKYAAGSDEPIDVMIAILRHYAGKATDAAGRKRIDEYAKDLSRRYGVGVDDVRGQVFA